MAEVNKRSLGKWRYQGHRSVRERVLARFSRVLARTTMPLWYLETLVLSARFHQKASRSDFGMASSTRTPYSNRHSLWMRGVLPYLQELDRPVIALEFGVATGNATRTWLSAFEGFSQWHGFDTFQGLPEPWTRGGVEVMQKGVFAPPDLANPFPRIDSYLKPVWHAGLISDTLMNFERPNDDPLFVLIDVDLLEPTLDILSWLKTHGRRGDCLYFDEAFDPFNEGLAIQRGMADWLRFRVLGYTGSALAVVIE